MEFFDRYINPIHLLGLRSYLRTKRFLYTFNISVLLMVSAMLLGFFFMSIERMPTAQIGKNLFMIFSIMQYVIIGLVFPAFSCTAIISEKEGKTYDLLVTANLSSGDIVWGKFLSAYTHSAMFLISSLPIVMMAFLFGGITPALIMITYAILFAYAALIVMLCLSISSVYKTITRAIIASYIVVIIINSFISPMLFFLLYDYLHDSELARFFIAIGGYGSLNVFLTVYIVPVFVFLSLIFAPYLVAKNSLRTYANNRSTSLKVYFTCVGSGILAIFLTYYINSIYMFIGIQQLDYEMIMMVGGFCLAIAGIFGLIGSLGFAGENPVPERFVMKRLSEHLKAGRIRRVFASKFFLGLLGPGSYRGARFVTLMCFGWTAIYLLATWLLIEKFGVNNTVFWRNYEASGYMEYPIISAFVVVSFVYFFSMLASFLSFRIRQIGFRRAVLFCMLLFLTILLPLYSLFSMEVYGGFHASILNFQYLSPSMCFFWSFIPISQFGGSKFSCLIDGVPIHYIGIGVYFSLGFLLDLLNYRRSRKMWNELEKEEKEILESMDKK
ncbi:ABC transporter permease [Candidatus Uabimicrobium amorphum]|uniref:ABC transporter permease n=1 Tax=Uabimicrobium amorphum TaxID=2596890 RepID=A0A5S9ILJ7_UABAM|nr:ABC transporter permease [Candidatus Uabimicrobium amorphum]BBM83666.1 ABC transporter permease [Candidatus Uabimicrobium amorphum]